MLHRMISVPSDASNLALSTKALRSCWDLTCCCSLKFAQSKDTYMHVLSCSLSYCSAAKVPADGADVCVFVDETVSRRHWQVTAVALGMLP